VDRAALVQPTALISALAGFMSKTRRRTALTMLFAGRARNGCRFTIIIDRMNHISTRTARCMQALSIIQ
jgi:hypothetical protein